MEKRNRIYIKGLKKKKLKGMEFIKRCEHLEENQLFSEMPTQNLFLLHYSEGSELDYMIIKNHLLDYGELEALAVLSGMNYGYITYKTIESSEKAYNTINSTFPVLPFKPKPHPITVLYTSVAFSDLMLIKGCICYDLIPVPGLTMQRDFISRDYESLIINELDKLVWNPLTNRRVQHFGFDFIYGANSVNPSNPSTNFPGWLNPLLDALDDKFGIRYDQLTVNDYQAGDSIPPHTDSHSPFEETLACVSLLSPISMSFRHNDSDFNQFIPERSLIVFKDEARYVWKHSIAQRRHDIYEGEMIHRKRRVSLTFRKIRKIPCECNYEEYCDRKNIEENKDLEKSEYIEKEFVYDVYDKIAPHFSHTRYKPWPKVEEFLQSKGYGTLVLDVGCGNGKYLHGEPLCRIGTDRSANLLKICEEKGFSGFTANCLRLPVRSASIEVAITIAVIHHLSTPDLRIKALSEILRVLTLGGEALVYVWAMEQTERTFTEQDSLVPWHLNKTYDSSEDPNTASLVDKIVYKRYYHVFRQGELEDLASHASCDTFKFEITHSYYDRSN